MWDVVTNTARANPAPSQWADQGLYTFSLGGGVDSLDYFDETDEVVVSVDTSADDTDLVFVGNGERIDNAVSVERYYAGQTAGNSWIDLANATVATTIQFSKEANSNLPANDAQEPDGNDGTTLVDLTRAAEVRNTADNTVYATFVDRTGNGIVPAALWTNVQGSNLAETVIFTDNETAAAHQLQLQAGANRVDYSALTATITANIGATDVTTVVLQQTHTVNGDTIWQNFDRSGREPADHRGHHPCRRPAGRDGAGQRCRGSRQPADAHDLAGGSAVPRGQPGHRTSDGKPVWSVHPGGCRSRHGSEPRFRHQRDWFRERVQRR
jgi:hypothetical protein